MFLKSKPETEADNKTSPSPSRTQEEREHEDPSQLSEGQLLLQGMNLESLRNWNQELILGLGQEKW